MFLGLDAVTAGLWRFDEQVASVRPVDLAGKIAPLGPVVGGSIPPVATGMAGKARTFTGAGFGFKGAEVVSEATRLRRSMTVEAIVKYAQNGARQVITCRGKKDGTATERRLFSVSIIRTGGVDKLSFEWDRTSGTAAVVGDITFVPPSGWFYVAAVREWSSAALATVTAYVGYMAGDVPVFTRLGSVTSTEADIEDGSGGEFTIGNRSNAGTYNTPYSTASGIDQLRLSSAARSAEELEHQFRSVFVYPGWGYDLLRALQPPGGAWSRALDSRVQLFFQVAGAGLGQAWSKAAELLNDFLPDRAWSFLDRWEAITRLSPRPFDTTQQRRDRVIGFLRKVQGYSRSAIATAVADLLAQLPGDVVIIENSNKLEDSFFSVAAYWTIEPNAGTQGSTVGKVDLDSQVGDDARWTGAAEVPVRMRTSVANDTEVEVIVSVTPNLNENGASCGLHVYNFVTHDAHLFGIQRSGGSNRWWHRTIVAGVAADVVGAVIPAGTVYWLRYHRLPGGTVDLQIRVDGAGYDGPWTTVFAGVTTIAASKDWAGPFVSVDTSPATANNGADFLDFRAWCPRSRNVFEWFVWRDPTAPPTTYDRQGAQLVINKLKPAHTRGTIVESTGFIVGSPYCRVGGETVGAPL